VESFVKLIDAAGGSLWRIFEKQPEATKFAFVRRLIALRRRADNGIQGDLCQQ